MVSTLKAGIKASPLKLIWRCSILSCHITQSLNFGQNIVTLPAAVPVCKASCVCWWCFIYTLIPNHFAVLGDAAPSSPVAYDCNANNDFIIA